MRIVAIVLGVLLFAGGLLSGCILLLMTASMFEPPTPSWTFQPSAAQRDYQTIPLGEGPQVVWIDQPAGHACHLAVRRADGTLLGEASGRRLCRVDARARADEIWTLEATAGPAATGALASDPPVALPRSLELGLGGAVLASLLGVVGIVVGAIGFRRPRATSERPR